MSNIDNINVQSGKNMNSIVNMLIRALRDADIYWHTDWRVGSRRKTANITLVDSIPEEHLSPLKAQVLDRWPEQKIIIVLSDCHSGDNHST